MIQAVNRNFWQTLSILIGSESSVIYSRRGAMNTTVCIRACLLLARKGFKVILVSAVSDCRRLGVDPDEIEHVAGDHLMFKSGGAIILLRPGRKATGLRADYAIVDDVFISTEERSILSQCVRFGPLHFVRTV